MTFVAERAFVNQKIQIAPESTIGTSVPANKLLTCFDWTVGVNSDIQLYRATGHKYPSVQEENTEWVDLTLGGTLDFNGILYPLNGVMGAVSPSSHGSSSTAKDWIFIPPITGFATPQTYTIEQGDANHAHKFSYGLFTTLGYKFDRKTATISGNMIGQPLSDGITLTSSPTTVALAPIASKMFNVYLDSSSGALGGTLLNRFLSVDYVMSGVYTPLYTINRANLGFTTHVDAAPTCTIKLLMEADTQGMAMLGYLQTGSTQYLRVQAVGNLLATDGPGSVFQTFTHDMAIKIGKPSTFQDKDGVFAIEWECHIVEDATWGKSQTITVTNLLTSL